MNTFRFSERRACELSGVSRTAYRYQAAPAKDHKARVRLIELANQHKGLGYPMLHGMLKSEGLVTNAKHTYRLYSEERLQLRKRKRKSWTGHANRWWFRSHRTSVGRWILCTINWSMGDGSGYSM